MIWRRKLLTPATFLIIIMIIFPGGTLTCHSAEYPIENECCPMCLPGNRVKTDCSAFRSTSCLPCVSGTFMDKPTGLKECIPCISCDEARGVKVKTSCTSTSNTVCEPLDGFYCIDPIGNHCSAAYKHRSCYPGQYIKQKGTAFTDTVCSECSTGTFSNGTFTSCWPHIQCESITLQLVKPGTASTDAECGEERSHVAVIVTITCVFLLISVGLVYLFCFRKKEMSLSPDEQCRSSNVSMVENEDEEQSESIAIPPD